MKGFNKVVVMGNLTRDPDRVSANSPVKFTIAVNKKYRTRNGDVCEHVDFIPCSAWGKLGDEVVLRYCRKGSPLFVEGEISTRDYDDPKSGEHKWAWEVNVSSVVLLGDGKRGSEQPATPESEAKRLAALTSAAKSGSPAQGNDGLSMRDGDLFPADDLGYGPHSDEYSDADIPF